MGPKPKKAKKTKAELEEERLAREEEDRKNREKEEKRQAEEAEKRRQDELKKAAEQKAFREKELARWREEYDAIVENEKDRAHDLAAEERAEENALDWLSFREPTGEVDARSEPDMNTFIAAMKEAAVNDMKEAMEVIRKVEFVAYKVEEVWANSLAGGDIYAQQKAYTHLQILHNIILEKVDQATLPLLRFYDKHVDDRVEMNVEEVRVAGGAAGGENSEPTTTIGQGVSVGMWATFSDMRPPRKSVQLEKMGIKLDIPKPLLQQQEKFTYRFIRMPIVTYNLQAYENPTAAPESPQDQKPPSPATEGEDSIGLHSLYQAKPSPSDLKYVVGDMIYFDILFSTPPPFTIRARKWTLRDRSTNSLYVRKSDYPSSAQCRMYVKVPSTVVLTDDMRMMVWDEKAGEGGSGGWSEEGISDYQYSETTRIVSFYITTVGLLALVKKRTTDIPLKSWHMYPVIHNPIHVHMDIHTAHTHVYIPSDSVKKFRGLPAQSVGHTGYAAYERHCRLCVTTATGLDLYIDVIGSQCALTYPALDTFADLLYVPLSPGILLYKLQRKGLNILPSLTHDIDVNCLKNPDLEQILLAGLAQGASSMEFRNSNAWATALRHPQKIGVLVRESMVYVCPEEENEYDCVHVEHDSVSMTYINTPELGLAPGGAVQYTLVIGDDYGRRTLFSPTPRPGKQSIHMINYAINSTYSYRQIVIFPCYLGEEVHMSLYKCLDSRVTSESSERVAKCNVRFAKTVYTLLKLIRPYSLS